MRRSSMTLFSDPTCQYSHRVRIVLAEKDVTVEIEDIEPSAITEEILEANPYGTLPTLVDRDLALYESKVVMEYLDERFPHPPLLPVYPVARAQSRLWVHRIEKDWGGLIAQIINSPESKKSEEARKEFRESLISIASIFTDMPYFMSEDFTLVDCCLGPILWRLPQLGIELPNNRQVKPLLDYMERLFRSTFIPGKSYRSRTRDSSPAMNMRSNRPYILRAFFDWIVDNDCTPYVAIDAHYPGVEVPQDYVTDGQIVLNIAPRAVTNFILDLEILAFSTRFGGVPIRYQGAGLCRCWHLQS